MAAPSTDGKKKNPVKAILAGGIAGGLEICCSYPTEYVKTQLQLDSEVTVPKYRGVIHCTTSTVKEHGILGLYRGLSPMLYSAIPKVSVRFSVYEFLCNHMADANGKLTQVGNLACGLGAGAADAILVACPTETIKVKFIHDQTQPKPQYKGFCSGVQTIIKTDGIRGIYQGLTATIIRQGSSNAIRFFVYNNLKSYLQGGDGTKDIGIVRTFIIGGVAGVANVFGNNPIDVVKTRMQGLDAGRYKNSLDCVIQIWKQEGPRAFYKGTVPRLGRVVFHVAFLFAIYEQVMVLLDRIW